VGRRAPRVHPGQCAAARGANGGDHAGPAGGGRGAAGAVGRGRDGARQDAHRESPRTQ